MEQEFESVVELWQTDKSAWYFGLLPVELSAELRELTNGMRGGFNSIRVEVRIGASVWRTSVFLDSKRACFMLPLKAEVRKAQNLSVGSHFRAAVTAIDFDLS